MTRNLRTRNDREVYHMKNTIVPILQQRMDKCTNEQFWVTGAITGLNAFLLSQNETIRLFFPSWAILAVSTIIFISAGFYMLNRHVGYYATREANGRAFARREEYSRFHDKESQHLD